MAQIPASIAAPEASNPLSPLPSDCFPSEKERKHFANHCFLAVVALLLFVGVVSLSVLAKDGQYYPRSSAAHRIPKASKMSERHLPELGNRCQALVRAFPDASNNVSQGPRLATEREVLQPRAAVVLASPPLRSPPRR